MRKKINHSKNTAARQRLLVDGTKQTDNIGVVISEEYLKCQAVQIFCFPFCAKRPWPWVGAAFAVRRKPFSGFYRAYVHLRSGACINMYYTDIRQFNDDILRCNTSVWIQILFSAFWRTFHKKFYLESLMTDNQSAATTYNGDLLLKAILKRFLALTFSNFKLDDLQFLFW